MANVINKTTLEYRESVNTPDFSNLEWIINPNVSEITNQEGKIIVPQKYWKLSGNAIVEMTLSEKTKVDDDEKKSKEKNIDSLNINIVQLTEALIDLGIITKKGLTDIIKSKI